jgi:lysophospholipase L1-like esterase
MRRLLAVLVLLAAVLVIPSPVHAANPLRILLVGDSITVGYSTGSGWRTTLQGLFESVGQPVQMEMVAVGGYGTSDLAPGFPYGLAALKPDLVLINLGTNDGWDIPGFEARYDKMLSAVIDMTSAKVGLAFIQYSASPPLAALEAAVNDAMYRRMYAHGFLNTIPPVWFAGLANFQDIPPSYLDSGGIHPTAAGYEIYAHKLYDAYRVSLGLPPIPYAYPALTGHRP